MAGPAGGAMPRVRPGTALVQVPGVVQGGTAAVAAWQQVAQVGGRIAEPALAELRARQLDDFTLAGAQAVARQADGALTVAFLPGNDDAERAYNRSAEAAYLARLQTDLRARAGELQAAHQFDAGAFDAGMSGLADGLLASVPGRLVEAAAGLIDREAAQGRTAILSATAARDRRLQHRDMAALADRLVDDGLALARAGAFASPEGATTARELRANLDAQVAAGFIGGDQADRAFDGFLADVQGQAIVGSILDTFEGAGEAAAMDRIRALRRAGVPGLDALQLDAALTTARGQVQQRRAETAAARAAAAAIWRDHLASIEMTGQGIPGAGGPAEEEMAARRLFGVRQAMQSGTPADIATLLDDAAPAPGQIGFADQAARYERMLREARPTMEAAWRDHLASIEMTGQGVAGLDGPAEEEAAARWLHGYRQALAQDDPAAIAGLLDDAAPIPGLIGFADRQDQHTRLTRMAGEVLAARLADPAAAAMQVPAVHAAFEAAGAADSGQDGAAAQRLRWEMQAELGVPAPARRVLTRAEADALVGDLHALPASERPLRLRALEAELGRDLYGRALGQLIDAGLDRSAIVLNALADDPLTAQTVASAIETPMADLRAGLEATDIADMTARIDADLAPFREVFAGPGTGADAQATFAALRDAALRAALLRHRQGTPMRDAADWATGRLVADRYEVVQSRDWSAYLPRLLDGQRLDIARIERAADAAVTREALDAFDPAPIGDPATAAAGLDGLLDRDRTIRTALNSGFWATSPDGRQLWLMLPFSGGGALPLMDRAGRPFAIDLLAASAGPEPAAPPPPAAGAGHPWGLSP